MASSTSTIRTAISIISLLSTLASTQVLQDGIDSAGTLPACSSACTPLQQAVTACGGQNAATQQIWSCFCQSAYLTSISTVCQPFCTEAGSNEQIASWYEGNCGDDFGATAHADDGSGGAAGGNGQGVTGTTTSAAVGGGQTSAVATTTTAADGTVQTSGSDSSGSSDSSASNSDGSSSSSDNDGGNQSWWDGHWKWIVMLIVLFFLLLALALLGVWLKRRHDRKADLITSGFNAGITTRSTPGLNDNSAPTPMDSTIMSGGAGVDGSGRNTPTRTREAFMPYGYGYARSESRLASRGDTRGATPLGEIEEKVGTEEEGAITPVGQAEKRKRVKVRERDFGGPESPIDEKGGS